MRKGCLKISGLKISAIQSYGELNSNVKMLVQNVISMYREGQERSVYSHLKNKALLWFEPQMKPVVLGILSKLME